ncbi:MAG: hypothetical protein OER86_13490, partial [Phycisphaerae bacterium]|nr:hypothetical protein [Phycisphaerae bacterium]
MRSATCVPIPAMLLCGLVCLPGCGGITDQTLAQEHAQWGHHWHLDLSGSRVTDAGLVYLRDLSRLQSLRLSDTAITD